jgi:PPP family 3-phenylpropionic acid transporter
MTQPLEPSRREEVPGPLALRAFYVAFFLAGGISVPFFPAYLRNLGLSGRQVTTVLAAAPLLHMTAPLLWGWAADRTQAPARLLRLACAGACLLYLPISLGGVRGFAALLVAYVLHQSFNVAIAGLTDSLALARVRHAGEDYGRARLWGSFAFMVSGLSMGAVLAARARPGGDPVIPALVTGFLALSFAVSFALRGRSVAARPRAHDVRRLLTDRRYLLLLAMTATHWACFAPWHALFAILAQDRGMSPRVTGAAFSVAVVGEMTALYFFRRVHARASLPTLLAFVAGISAIRWVATAQLTSPTALIAIQLLHGFSFGLFWGSALAWLAACVPPSLRATGQTLFTAATFGIGSIVGTLGAGAIYDASGGARAAFLVAACVELVVLALALGPARRLRP